LAGYNLSRAGRFYNRNVKREAAVILESALFSGKLALNLADFEMAGLGAGEE